VGLAGVVGLKLNVAAIQSADAGDHGRKHNVLCITLSSGFCFRSVEKLTTSGTAKAKIRAAPYHHKSENKSTEALPQQKPQQNQRGGAVDVLYP
jgi:hypothetical protein